MSNPETFSGLVGREGPPGDRYARAFLSSAIPIAEVSPAGRLLAASPSFADLLRVQPEEVRGLYLQDLLHQEGADAVLRGLADLGEDSTRSFQTESRVKLGDGRVLWIHLCLGAVPEENGAVERVLCWAGDITEKKRAEAATRASEDRYRRIFTLSPNPAGITRASDGLLVELNDSFRRVFGFTKEEALGRTIIELGMITPEDRAEYTPLIQEQKVLELYEVHYRGKNGEPRPVLLSIEHLDLDGEDHYLWEMVDLREVKSLEAQVRQAQKLETLGTLAGGIAHDFNNLLVPILGYADLLESGAPPDDPIRKSLENHLLDASVRARELVRQILTFSRKEAAVRTTIRIEEPVRKALGFLEASLPASVRVQKRIGPVEGAVLADKTQIEQVVLNLCTNAAHAMRDGGGVLEVSLRTVRKLGELKQRHPDFRASRAVLLSVRDTGRGIPPEILENIFDPFFTTKTPDEGTGLGLSIVYGIVKSYGGVVEVESQPNVGTCFRVYFPQARAGAETATASSGTEIRGRERLLVVDDREASRDAVCNLLEPLGYGVTLASSGAQAHYLFGQDPHRFDLALIDYDMPQVTGTQLALELLEIREDLPIVLMTGGDPARIADAEHLGMKGRILKPFTAAELAATIRRALDGG